MLEDLAKAGCEIRGDDAVRAVFPAAKAGHGRRLEDRISRRHHRGAAWSMGWKQAIRHIEHYGSHHTDSIVTEDAAAAETFLSSAG